MVTAIQQCRDRSCRILTQSDPHAIYGSSCGTVLVSRNTGVWDTGDFSTIFTFFPMSVCS